jgi:LAGLIDADG endonuclease
MKNKKSINALGIPLNPNYITGLTDGDGRFFVGIKKRTNSVGWSVKLSYSITAGNNSANIFMLVNVNQFFGNIGSIVFDNSSNVVRLEVHGLENCLKIREHFWKYPLLTYKLVYFQLWSSIIDLMITKVHLTFKVLLLIIAFMDHFPKGLSKLLKSSFPNYISITKPDYSPNLIKMNIHWIAGFINANGGFFLPISKSETHKLGEACKPCIQITQHEISIKVLKQIKIFLGYGQLYNRLDKTTEYRISSIKNINAFISKFNEGQLLGAKALDYSDFCKGINIINSKKHLSKDGIIELKNISLGMNTKRTNFGS